MNVTGAFLNGTGENSIDQFDDRRFLDLCLQGGDRNLVVLAAVHDLDVFFIELPQQVLKAIFDRLVVLLDRFPERILAGDNGLDLVSRGEAQLVDRVEVGRVRHRDRQRAAHTPQRQHQVAHRDLRLHQLDHPPVDLVDPRKIDRLHPVLARQHPGQVGLGDDTERYQGVAQTATIGALLAQGTTELLFRNQPFTDQQIAD